MAWPRRSAPCGIADGLSSQSRSEQLQPRANPGWSGSQRSRQRVRPALRSIAPSRCGWWADREPEIRRDNRRRGSQNHLFWFLGFLGLCFGVWVSVSVVVVSVVVVAGRSVECVWSVCVGNVWLLVQGVPSVSVWSGLDTLPPHPLSAGHGRLLHNWYLSHSSHRQCRQPQGRTKCRGTNQGGGERGEGGALLGSGHTNLPTHDTQHTAHSTQLTAHSARVHTHTHTGTQGHTVGTLGGLALSSASTHSSGPPNDAHHGRSALHQRRQAASRSSPWWTPPPSG